MRNPPTTTQLRTLELITQTLSEVEGMNRSIATPRTKREADQTIKELRRWTEEDYTTRVPRCFIGLLMTRGQRGYDAEARDVETAKEGLIDDVE